MTMLYLIRGLPGSGKSTFAKGLVKALNDSAQYTYVTHLEADQYFVDAQGSYVWCADRVHLAHQYCYGMAEDSMLEGWQVVVSNTFTTEKELKPYLELAERYGYTVTTMIIENRHGNASIHGVPDETMAAMKARFSVKL